MFDDRHFKGVYLDKTYSVEDIQKVQCEIKQLPKKKFNKKEKGKPQ
jgi:hypothetical protein